MSTESCIHTQVELFKVPAHPVSQAEGIEVELRGRCADCKTPVDDMTPLERKRLLRAIRERAMDL